MLSKLFGFAYDGDTVNLIVSCKPWAIEKALMYLHTKIDKKLFKVNKRISQGQPQPSTEEDARPESDQGKKRSCTMVSSVFLYSSMH